MNPDSSLEDFMRACRERTERVLDARLPPADRLPQRLHQAMRYAVLDGGKRLRPLLTYATGRTLGIALDRLDGPACALELIHAYSLVHDDLPAMDDDTLRRGKPTCHVAFDEATAILTGDALQALAFQVLACDETMELPARNRLQMIASLALACGSHGMVGGQSIDLDAVGRSLSLPELENMHIYKTGALIRASVKLAILAQSRAESQTVERLDHYAKCIGLAFQIQDDILDVESDTATLGKTRGKDRDNHKPNYPDLLGLRGAKQKARQLHQEALSSLDTLGTDAGLLRQIASYIITRRH